MIFTLELLIHGELLVIDKDILLLSGSQGIYNIKLQIAAGSVWKHFEEINIILKKGLLKYEFKLTAENDFTIMIPNELTKAPGHFTMGIYAEDNTGKVITSSTVTKKVNAGSMTLL